MGIEWIRKNGYLDIFHKLNVQFESNRNTFPEDYLIPSIISTYWTLMFASETWWKCKFWVFVSKIFTRANIIHATIDFRLDYLYRIRENRCKVKRRNCISFGYQLLLFMHFGHAKINHLMCISNFIYLGQFFRKNIS